MKSSPGGKEGESPKPRPSPDRLKALCLSQGIALTDEQGKVSFDLSDGSYMFRVDYLGYQFWTEVYGVPDTLIDTIAIPHLDVTVTVNNVNGSDVDPIENIKAYLFTAAGAYMGMYGTTDSNGQVVFSLPEKDYKEMI